MATFTAHKELTPETLEALLNREVPAEWTSVQGSFINECDTDRQDWRGRLFRAMYEVVALRTPGASKKEDKDYYLFEMESNFELSKSLKEAGWNQYNCTIRLPQKEGMKAKRTSYSLHFWGKQIQNGRVCLDTVILAKLKLEGKYLPELGSAEDHELSQIIRKWYKALEG